MAESIRGVASDLRLIDLPDLVSYLKTGQIASIGSLVQASIELSFKPETLTFGHAGDVYLEWGSLPRVLLDMEFHHQSVHVYFRLILEAEEAGVEITYISFEGESVGPGETRRGCTRRSEKRASIEDARGAAREDAGRTADCSGRRKGAGAHRKAGPPKDRFSCSPCNFSIWRFAKTSGSLSASR